MTIIEQFDPDVKKIETEIINRLMQSSISTARGEYTSKILNYFLTRRKLTQRKLQELTDISSGKISQEVNDLVDMGIIKIIERTSKGEIIYSMESIQSENFTRGINLVKTALQWEEKFMQIKDELERDKKNLEKLNGYEKIKAIIEENLSLMAGYRKFLELWKNIQQKFEENKK